MSPMKALSRRLYQHQLQLGESSEGGTLLVSMVGVAQLVRAPGCGPGGRGFETPRPPHSLAGIEKSMPAK